MKRAATAFDWFNYVFLAVVCFTTFYPFWTQIVISLSTAEAYYRDWFHFIPKSFNLVSYKFALENLQVIRSFFNSVIVTAAVRKTDPDAVVESIPPWSAKGYTFVPGSGAMELDHFAIPSSSKYPEKAVEVLEYLNSREGAITRVIGVEGLQWENLTPDGYFDRIEENWDPQHDYYFGMGSASIIGYVPWWDHDTFEEAYANRVILDERKLKDDKRSIKNLLAWGARWRGPENPFRFVSISGLEDIQAELWDAVETGWIKMIAAPAGKFDSAWGQLRRKFEQCGPGRVDHRLPEVLRPAHEVETAQETQQDAASDGRAPGQLLANTRAGVPPAVSCPPVTHPSRLEL